MNILLNMRPRPYFWTFHKKPWPSKGYILQFHIYIVVKCKGNIVTFESLLSKES